MLFLCTNYNFSGCVKKGTNLVIRVDSKLFDRQNKPASGQASQRTSQPADKPASGQASQRTSQPASGQIFYKLIPLRDTAVTNKIILIKCIKKCLSSFFTASCTNEYKHDAIINTAKIKKLNIKKPP